MAEEIFEQRELLELILQGVTRANSAGDGSPIRILCRDDGTLQTWSFNVGSAPNGDTVIGVENTGEQRMMNMGWDGTSFLRFLLEATGEQRMVLVAKDAAAALQDLRVNPRDELQVDSHGFPVHVDPTNLTVGTVTIHTVPAGAVDTVELEFNLHTGATETLVVHVRPSGAPAGGAEQRWEGAITDGTRPVRLGPYHLEAGGTISIVSTTGSLASAQPIVWRKTL